MTDQQIDFWSRTVVALVFGLFMGSIALLFDCGSEVAVLSFGWMLWMTRP